MQTRRDAVKSISLIARNPTLLILAMVLLFSSTAATSTTLGTPAAADDENEAYGRIDISFCLLFEVSGNNGAAECFSLSSLPRILFGCGANGANGANGNDDDDDDDDMFSK
jgi:hypothetical protein